MSHRSWTLAETAYLRAHYADTDTRALARHMGRSFSAVRSRAKSLGITKGTRREWIDAEIAIVKARYANETTHAIASDLGRTDRQVYQKAYLLGLSKSQAHLDSPLSGRIRPGAQIGGAGRFPKGHIPHNKGKPFSPGGRSVETRFKKGNVPQTWVPIGTETVDPDGYRKRKVSDDHGTGNSRRGWQYVHRLLWQEHHGSIPQGSAVVFRNGDPSDIRIDNLELITRAELALRNGVARFPPELRSLIATQAHLTRCINEAEHEKQD